MEKNPAKWIEVAPEVRGAVRSYRRSDKYSTASIHQYSETKFHFECLGVSETYDSLEKAMDYASAF